MKFFSAVVVTIMLGLSGPALADTVVGTTQGSYGTKQGACSDAQKHARRQARDVCRASDSKVQDLELGSCECERTTAGKRSCRVETSFSCAK